MRIFHSITAVLLLSILLAGTGMRTFITIRFYLEQDQIAKEKCENKDKPTLKCNGKCYLAKQLKKTEEEKNENSSPIPPDRFSFPELSLICSADDEFEHSFNAEDGPTFESAPSSILSRYSTIIKPPPEC